MAKSILDINCDLGEGVGNDQVLMPLLDSCNIACGGHTGDEKSMRESIQLAKANHVLVGAHPSYPDRENFGRLSLEVDLKELEESLLAQIKTFEKICLQEGLVMNHVKPHGALYNDAAKKKDLANLILKVMSVHFPNAYLYCPPKSLIEQLAIERKIKIKREVFADRNYEADLSLVARSKPKALITDPIEASEHVMRMLKEGRVKTLSGQFVPIQAETICIHGDNPAALDILKKIRESIN